MTLIDALNEANEIIHNVEKEYHYPLMIKYGYVPVNKTGLGLVRSFEWINNNTNHKIRYTIGVNADYWEHLNNGHYGYWRDLDSYLTKINKEKE